MGNIRKYMTGLFATGLVMAAVVPSHAFTSKGVVTSTASATIGGGLAQMSVSIVGGSSVTWNATAGSGWTLASQYIQIASTLTIAGSGIQTYTQNSGGLFTGANSSTTAAGLVNLSSATQTIPLAWQINGSTSGPVGVADPNCTGASGQPSYCATQAQTGWAWFYYADKGVNLLANAPGNFYIQVESAGNPVSIQYAQGSFGAGAASSVNKLYLEALFQNALSGNTYKTNTLTVESFTP